MIVFISRIIISVIAVVLAILFCIGGRKLVHIAKEVDSCDFKDAIVLFCLSGVCIVGMILNLCTTNYSILSAKKCHNCHTYNAQTEKYCKSCGIWIGGNDNEK